MRLPRDQMAEETTKSRKDSKPAMSSLSRQSSDCSTACASTFEEPIYEDKVYKTLSAKSQPPPSALQRLSRKIVWILVIGLFCSLCVVALLVFFWVKPKSNSVWRRAILASWLTRTISLSALILRWTTTAHAGAATSMLAALALQRAEVLLPYLAKVSDMRYLDLDPRHLLEPLAMAVREGHRSLVWPLALALTLTTALLQFTSTLLLSDLSLAMQQADAVTSERISYMKGNTADRLFTWGTNSATGQYQWTPWSRPPALIPTMAQYDEPGSYEPGFYDTGVAFRALLPFYDASERSLLAEYNGGASVFNSQVVCMKPDLSIEQVAVHYHDIEKVISISGTFENPPSSDLLRAGSDATCHFQCNTTLTQLPEKGGLPNDWLISMCRVDSTTVLKPYWSNTAYHRALSYLVFNVTLDMAQLTRDAAYGWLDLVGINTKERPSDEQRSEWIRFYEPANIVTMDISLCFANTGSNDIFVAAQRSSNHTEALIGWDLSLNTYNTSDMRRSLGATDTNYTIQERGHLDLVKPSQDNFQRIAQSVDGRWAQTQSTAKGGNWSYCLNIACENRRNVEAVHPQLAAIFNDVILDTGHPALAVQAILTTVISIVYYDFVIGFDGSAETTVASFVPVLEPLRWLGLSIVIGALGLHLLLLVGITIMFVQQATGSLLGNSWASTAQVVTCEQVSGWIADVRLREDGDVQDAMRLAEVDDVAIGIHSRVGDVRLVRRGRSGKILVDAKGDI